MLEFLDLGLLEPFSFMRWVVFLSWARYVRDAFRVSKSPILLKKGTV